MEMEHSCNPDKILRVEIFESFATATGDAKKKRNVVTYYLPLTGSGTCLLVTPRLGSLLKKSHKTT